MQTDKYNVAWFKIAECVSRGEKERALGVYRLLSHSFNDNAVARQLEGDIYCAFKDYHQATDLYKQAAEQYKKSGRFLESAAMYEHLIILSSQQIFFIRNAFEMYKKLGITIKVEKYGMVIAQQLVHNREWDEIMHLLEQLSEEAWCTVRARIYQCIISTLHDMQESDDRLKDYTQKAIDDLFLVEDPTSLQEFLSAIQAIDTELYEYACEYIKR